MMMKKNKNKKTQFQFYSPHRSSSFRLPVMQDFRKETGRFSSDVDAEADAEQVTVSSSISPFLSLTEKPDRNLSMLDDYEMEESDTTDSDPNHRSG